MFEEVDGRQGCVERRGRRRPGPRRARPRAAQPHSMDRRLHDVVRGDVVVPGQRQPRRLHRDPATRARVSTAVTRHRATVSRRIFQNELEVMIQKRSG